MNLARSLQVKPDCRAEISSKSRNLLSAGILLLPCRIGFFSFDIKKPNLRTVLDAN
jgi:hypothetical protein